MSLRDLKKFRGTLSNSMIHNFVCWFQDDAINFDAWYQRDYVWGHKEQQDFLSTLISGFPVGTISLSTDQSKETKWVEVVDGKQRLITLKLFLENKITFNGLYYKDFDKVDARFFRNLALPYYDLSHGTEKDKLEFFYRVNFTGVPQSKEHQDFIEKEMNRGK